MNRLRWWLVKRLVGDVPTVIGVRFDFTSPMPVYPGTRYVNCKFVEGTKP